MRRLTVADIHTYYVLAGNTPVLVHNEGGDDYNQAMNKALAWLEGRGFKAEKTTIGRLGDIQGKPIGVQTADGKAGSESSSMSEAVLTLMSGAEKRRVRILPSTPLRITNL